MSKVNGELVPTIEGTVRNQPCFYGALVEGHSVYCDNDESPYRKCRHSWYYGRAESIIDKCADEDCEYFKANPEYKEDRKQLDAKTEVIKRQREEAKNYMQSLRDEGYSCPDCIEGLPMKGKKILCSCGTLVKGLIKERPDKDYTDDEIDKHAQLDPMNIEMQKSCKYFKGKRQLTIKKQASIIQ